MANLEELVVSLVAETSGLRAELAKATTATKDATQKMDKAIEEFSSNSSKNVNFFQTAMATMTGFLGAEAVQAVIGFAKDGLEFMSEQLQDGAIAAQKEELALTKLANSLAVSGQYSATAMKSIEEFTGQMEELTGIEDDVIASNLAVLSSLTRMNAEGLKSAQKAALDMSVALGIDLDGATRLVAKGIEGNVEAFKRYGINIQEGTTRTETMTNVINGLEKAFGGAAAGAAQTFSGSIKGLTNAWGNLNEEIAKSLVKNPVVIAMMNELTKIFNNMTKEAKDAGTIIMEFVARGFIETSKAVATLFGVADKLFTFFMAGFGIIREAITGAIGLILAAGKALGVLNVNDPFAMYKDSFKALEETLNGDNTLTKLSNAFDEVAVAGENAFYKIGKASDATNPSIKNQIAALDELGGKQKEMLLVYAQGLEDQGMALDNQFKFENQLRQQNLDLALAQDSEYNQNRFDLISQDFDARQSALAEQYASEQAQLDTALAAQNASASQAAAAKLALQQKFSLAYQNIETQRAQFDKQMNDAKLQGMSTFFSGLSALQESSSKELQAIGKAAAIADTTIKAYMAIQNALATVPYPYNIAAAAGIGVQAFANVAKIAGIGFNEGGTLVGGGANRDSVPATLTKGETVVTRDLTDKMNDFFNNGGNSSSNQMVTVELSLKDHLIEFIEAKIVERQRVGISLIEAM